VWSVFRTLHWCNPFLQLVFNRIGNDMESLCDQRVLERLEGEARREYGAILLSMVSEKYPRAPGTTSLSNGGANIGRRIGAIARFQKYPKGMALVSVCIAVLLLQPALMGARAKWFHPPPDARRSLGLRAGDGVCPHGACSTAAGALDTYAKGVLLDNGIYIAMASPCRHRRRWPIRCGRAARRTDRRVYLQGYLGGSWARASDAYKVFNLQRQDDGSYSALLVFRMDSLIVDARAPA
jgi:hypothetical protein